ncbi:MAG: hypothetical protein ACK4M7_05620, partial [Burkholderiales bacterium]
KWAQAHLEDDSQQIMNHLCNELSSIIGYEVNNACHQALHRWRYANIGKQSDLPMMIDNVQKLAACGDWCIQGRVEAAFTSAIKLADSMIQFL